MRWPGLLISALLLLACQERYPSEIQSCLAKAQDNRAELEAVLDHYRSDSLKFRAACYLIFNMEGHFADHQVSELPDLVTTSYTYVDSLTHSLFYSSDDRHQVFEKDSLEFERKIKLIADRLLANISFIEQPKGEFFDLQSIKAEWLIDHIDNAFYLWQRSLYAKNLSWEEFRQTLLTYRYRSEALDVPSSFYRTHLASVLNVNQLKDLKEVVNRYNAYTFYADCFEDDGKHLGDLGFYDILQFYQYECSRQSEWTARALNASGLPTHFDFTASWLNRNRHHYWVAVRDTTGIYRPFTPKWQALDDTSYFRRTSKVYRRTFDKQATPFTLKAESEEIPDLFNNAFFQDVSEQYHTVVNLSIPYNRKAQSNHLGYLAIFSADGWKPVAWGVIDQHKGVINYEKVPVDVVYIAGTYRNKKIEPIGAPFFLDKQGGMHPIEPDHRRKRTLLLTRKFYRKEDMIAKMEAMIGARLQGANRPDFSDAEDLHTLSAIDMQDMAVRAIPVHSNRRYRYLRCLPLTGKKLNLAIFEVYTQPIHGKPALLGTRPSALDAKEEKILLGLPDYSRVPLTPLGDTAGFKAVMDGNMETFLTTPVLAIDLSEPILIKEIRLAPRNANNGIVVGDHYELLYYDQKWKSAGVKIAKSNYLIYENIPQNTLYWLKNLDHGKEEQAFTYHKGMQMFINHDAYAND